MEYFRGRGVALPEDGALDYEQLVSVLMNPDDDVPAQMVDALYFVHEMADNDAMEQLLSAARTRGLDLDLGDEPTAADVAVTVWLAAPDLLQELHAESYVMRPKSFEYYSGATRRKRRFPDYRKGFSPMSPRASTSGSSSKSAATAARCSFFRTAIRSMC